MRITLQAFADSIEELRNHDIDTLEYMTDEEDTIITIDYNPCYGIGEFELTLELKTDDGETHFDGLYIAGDSDIEYIYAMLWDMIQSNYMRYLD